MEMVPVKDIDGMISFEEAKKELARISELLSNTTDDIVFSMRLSSTKALFKLINQYCTLEQIARHKEIQ